MVFLEGTDGYRKRRQNILEQSYIQARERESTGPHVLALHAANPVWNPGSTYGPLDTAGIILEQCLEEPMSATSCAPARSKKIGGFLGFF